MKRKTHGTTNNNPKTYNDESDDNDDNDHTEETESNTTRSEGSDDEAIASKVFPIEESPMQRQVRHRHLRDVVIPNYSQLMRVNGVSYKTKSTAVKNTSR